MDNIFQSDEGIKFLVEVGQSLKGGSQIIGNGFLSVPKEDFSPWHSFSTATDLDVTGKLTSYDYEKGQLLLDPYHLHAINEFLFTDGKLINDSLPVPQDDWPVMVNVAQSRPDIQSTFAEGRALLASSPELDYQYDNIIEFVVPLDRDKPSGYDSELCFGVIFRTFPKGRTGLLAGFQLAHGLGHNVGMSLFSVDPIFTSDLGDQIFYEPRHDTRTAHHAFVSAVALCYMIVLSRALYKGIDRPIIADEHVSGYSPYLPDALGAAVRSLKASCEFTSFGKEVIKSLEEMSV